MAGDDKSLGLLSEAERDVTEAILQGARNDEIARRRGTSARTVAHQIARVYKKLGVTSRSELSSKLLQARVAAAPSPPRSRPDAIAIVEAAYRPAESHAAWLTGVASSLAPLVGAELGVAAYLYDTRAGAPLRVHSIVGVGCPDGFREGFAHMFAGAAQIPPELMSALRRNVSVASQAMGAEMMMRLPGMGDRMASLGVRDFLRLVAEDPSGRGCVFNALLPARASAAAFDTGLLARILAHVAAGFRMRPADGAGALGPASEVSPAEAVLDARGRLVDATGEAKTPRAAEALGAALAAMQRARGRLRRSAPREAVEAWRALVDARWSIVEELPDRGPPVFTARRNAAACLASPLLSPAEAHVALWAALGHSNKLIGYELGLAESAVAMRLSRAYKKLGVRSRVELAVALARAREAAPFLDPGRAFKPAKRSFTSGLEGAASL